MRTAVVLLLLTAGPHLEGATSWQQQDAPRAEPAPNLVVGAGSGTPGELVVLPIYYASQGLEVGRLKLEISFVSANLKYERIERGIAGEMGDVSVSATLSVGKNERDVGTSTLTTSMTAPAGGNPGIPPGLLAYLSLRISASGRPAVITLRTRSEASEWKTNRALDAIRSANGTVEVIAPGTEAAVNCFFFNH